MNSAYVRETEAVESSIKGGLHLTIGWYWTRLVGAEKQPVFNKLLCYMWPCILTREMISTYIECIFSLLQIKLRTCLERRIYKNYIQIS
jgi:hypothetical protein